MGRPTGATREKTRRGAMVGTITVIHASIDCYILLQWCLLVFRHLKRWKTN